MVHRNDCICYLSGFNQHRESDSAYELCKLIMFPLFTQALLQIEELSPLWSGIKMLHVIAQMKPVRPKQRRWAPSTVFTTCVTTNWFCCTSEGLLFFERAPQGTGSLLHAGFTLLAGLRPFMGVAHVHLRRCFRDEPQNAAQSAPVACFLCTGNGCTDECLCPRVLPATTFIISYNCNLPPA